MKDLQAHSLERLFYGKPVHLNDKKEIVSFFENQHREKPSIFSKKTKLEQQVFEKYIKNFSLSDFTAFFSESCLLFLKKNLRSEELQKLKNFKILNKLIASIEIENNLKNQLLYKINKMEFFKKLQPSEKKDFINLVISFSAEISAYNKNYDI